MTAVRLEQHRPSSVPVPSGPPAEVVDLRTLSDQRDARLLAARRQRLDDRATNLGRLVERRPDLRGVHGPADLALESLLSGV